MEQLAYRVKQRFPGVFRWIEAAARGVTVLRYGRRIRRARAEAVVRGSVRGETAVMRPLGLDDLGALHGFLAGAAYCRPTSSWFKNFRGSGIRKKAQL